MERRNLNDRLIKSLKPARAGQRTEIMDSVVPSFGVRVTDKGAKSYFLITRYPGRPHPARRSLGECGAIGLAEAREKARAWLALIARGIDPAVEEQRQRLLEERKRAHTFEAVATDFIKHKLATERRGRDAELAIRGELIPAWGSRPISEITPLDVLAVIRPIKDRAPYQAHAVLGVCKRLFGWAIDQHAYGLDTSPADRIKPAKTIGERKPRSRMLSDDEIRALWRAAVEIGYPCGDIIRMLLLTGARHHEVSEATWSEFDLDKTIWTIGQERFKSAVEHTVPLTSDAVDLLKGLPRFNGPYLFTSTDGKKPTNVEARRKLIIDDHMRRELGEVRPWVVHDLRRVVRSHLAALRIPDHVAEMVLGHGRKGLQRVYDQHRYETERREALTMWAGRLRSIVEPPPANVVPIKARV